MAWLHDTFLNEPTDALRLVALRRHIAEVEAVITAGFGSDGQTIDTGPLNDKVTRLMAYLIRLESSPLNMTGGGVNRVRIARPS